MVVIITTEIIVIMIILIVTTDGLESELAATVAELLPTRSPHRSAVLKPVRACALQTPTLVASTQHF